VELTFTGRGVSVDDDLKDLARHKLARLERMEPRVVRVDLEFIVENHPTVEGTTRVEAALHTPRRSFRAHAEAEDPRTGLDRLTDRLERQLRDHHGKRRARLFRHLRRSGRENPLDSESRTQGPADTGQG
jgi:ribosomal subunit interface protein